LAEFFLDFVLALVGVGMLVVIPCEEILAPVVGVAGAARKLVNSAIAGGHVRGTVEVFSFVHEPVSADVFIGPVRNLMWPALVHVNELFLIASREAYPLA